MQQILMGFLQILKISRVSKYSRSRESWDVYPYSGPRTDNWPIITRRKSSTIHSRAELRTRADAVLAYTTSVEHECVIPVRAVTSLPFHLKKLEDAQHHKEAMIYGWSGTEFRWVPKIKFRWVLNSDICYLKVLIISVCKLVPSTSCFENSCIIR